MCLRRIRIFVTRARKVEIDLCMSVYRRQNLAHLCLFPVFFQIFAGAGRFQFICVPVCIFDAAVVLDDLCGRLLAHPRHAGNVVRSIAHQRLHINEFFRRDTVALFHFRRIVILHLGPSLLRLRDADLHMLCRKLQSVPVS